MQVRTGKTLPELTASGKNAEVRAAGLKYDANNVYLATTYSETQNMTAFAGGFAPIFPDICYHLTHYKPAAADIPVASDNPAHYADAIRYNARTPLQGSLLPLTRLVWA